MDFELTQDQRDLQEGIRSLVAGALPLETTRLAEGTADVIDPAGWSTLNDAGVFSLLVDESAGGTGRASVEERGQDGRSRATRDGSATPHLIVSAKGALRNGQALRPHDAFRQRCRQRRPPT